MCGEKEGITDIFSPIALFFFCDDDLHFFLHLVESGIWQTEGCAEKKVGQLL